MKILALDSSGMVASAAIIEDDVLIGEYSINHKKTHSQTLLPMLDEIVKMTETDLEDGDTIMVAQVGSSNTIFRTSKTYEYQAGTLTELPEDENAVENGRQAFVSEEDQEE